MIDALKTAGAGLIAASWGGTWSGMSCDGSGSM